MKDLYVLNNNIEDIDLLESNFIERVNFNNSNQNLENQVVLINYEDFENNSQDDK